MSRLHLTYLSHAFIPFTHAPTPRSDRAVSTLFAFSVPIGRHGSPRLLLLPPQVLLNRRMPSSLLSSAPLFCHPESVSPSASSTTSSPVPASWGVELESCIT